MYVKRSGCKIIVILVLQRWREQLRSTVVTVIADYFSLHKDHVIRASLDCSERRIGGTTYIVLKMSQFLTVFGIHSNYFNIYICIHVYMHSP